MNPQHTPFNGDRHIGLELAKLIKKFGVRHVIETGMWSAHTTRELRKMVPGDVATIDPDFSHLVEEFGVHAYADLKALSIDPYQLDSAKKLFDVMLEVNDDDGAAILFYLDAHGGGINGTSTNPLREELDQISQAQWCCNNCVIMIHDFYNPLHTDYGYTWGGWFGRAEPLSYMVLERFECLPKIFPAGWQYHYNHEAEGTQRGVIYIYPKARQLGETKFAATLDDWTKLPTPTKDGEHFNEAQLREWERIVKEANP